MLKEMTVAPAVPLASPTTCSFKVTAFYTFRFPASKISLCHRPLALCHLHSSTAYPNPIKGSCDPELRSVLELASDSELYHLQSILFGPSYLSPLLKSIANGAHVDCAMIEEDLEERDDFISVLQERFLFLAADARSTLRGERPSYRNVLLGVRKKMNISCSRKLSTEDLEMEIFLHILQEYSRNFEEFPVVQEKATGYNGQYNLESGLAQWKLQVIAALRVGGPKLRSMIINGSGIFALGKIYQLLATGLSGKMLLEAAKCQLNNEVLKKGGQLATFNLESRVALLAARKGLAKAASNYLGLRSMMVLLGPIMWGTFLADVVIQMLGTDYARILRAIYVLALIRITRRNKFLLDNSGA